MRVKGKIQCYLDRVKNRNHQGRLRFTFSGNWNEVKEIIKLFGDIVAKCSPPKDREKYYPVLCYGAYFAAADFKYCYEEFENLIHKRGGFRVWRKAYKIFDVTRINELYDCIDRSPDLK